MMSEITIQSSKFGRCRLYSGQCLVLNVTGGECNVSFFFFFFKKNNVEERNRKHDGGRAFELPVH